MKCVVGFDTSNYTTSVAVCLETGEIIANLKRPLPVKEGEVGLRQADAVFAHVKNLPSITDELAGVLKGHQCVAVGVSSTPRMSEGSYMPCFLCGKVAAHSFAATAGLPIFETAHQNGHVAAAMYSSGAYEKLIQNRFIAFHVSGGTTEALLVTPSNNGTYLDISIIGATNDINAGQAIDRVGVMLGLSFPCGKELEKLACAYTGELTKKKVCVRDGYCSLSGIENLAKAMYEKGAGREHTAAFVFDFLCRTLCEMGEQLLQKYGDMPILFAGGVMSNTLMRKELSSKFEAYFCAPEFSADNAAGVARICWQNAKKEKLL